MHEVGEISKTSLIFFRTLKKMAKKVCVIIASDSDKDISDKTIEVLSKFNIPYQYEQASAHREPKRVEEIVRTTDADIFICVAGLAAALPGFVASLTNKPVIGVPKDVKLNGLDALLSMIQMPPGVPVATVGVDNGKNAAYLAIRILGLKYPEVLVGESSSSSTSYSPGKAALQSFQFDPPAPSSSSSSSQSSFSAFPLFASEPATSAPAYTSAPSPTASLPPPPPSRLEQKNNVYGDWGIESKKKERPRGDWLQY